MKNNSLKKSKWISLSGLSLLMIVYILGAAIFFYVASPQLKYEKADDERISAAPNNATTGEMIKGTFVEQTFVVSSDAINELSFMVGTYNRKNEGSIEVSVLDEGTSELLFQKEYDISAIKDNSFFKVEIKDPLTSVSDKQLRLRISPKHSVDGNAITLWYNDAQSNANQQLYINGTPSKGVLAFNVSAINRVPFEWYYFLTTTGIGLFLLGYGGYMVWSNHRGRGSIGTRLIANISKYRFLMNQLVSRDFKTKYRRSFLGVLWSVLNPLLMMVVVSSVFSYVFRFNIEKFPVYLILGQTLFNFLSESTTTAMGSVIGSASLIKKVYVPKYIFPLEKVAFSFVNFLISFVAIGIVLLVYKVPVYSTIICLPLILSYFFIFCSGLGLLLATVSVFFRDTLHLYSVFLTAWSYLSPIFYPVDSLSRGMQFFMKFNPMYHFIQYFRNIILYGVMPTIEENLICLGIALITLLLGVWVYKRKQDRFILYI